MPVTLAAEDVVYTEPPPEELPPEQVPVEPAPVEQASVEQTVPVVDAPIPVEVVRESAAAQPPIQTSPPPADAYPADATTTEAQAEDYRWSPEREAALAERVAAAPVGTTTASPVAAPVSAVPVDAAATAPVPSPGLGGVAEYTPAPGLLEQAANAAGEYVAPLIAQAPEPVQNLANIVGQPVGGAVEAAQEVGNQIGEGDISGTQAAMLAPLSGAQQQAVGQVSTRLYEGESAIPQNETFADPGNIGAIIGGLATTYGPAPAASGLTYEDWWRQNEADARAMYETGGPQAPHDAWLDATGAPTAPPPELVNPFDITTDNPLEYGAHVLTSLPRTAGGFLKSAKQGTLGPFVLNQAQQIVEDPLTAFDVAGGHKITTPLRDAALGGVKKLPGIRGVTQLAPEETARIAREQGVASINTFLEASEAQPPATRGVTLPAEAVDLAPPALGVTITPRITPRLGTETFRATNTEGMVQDFGTLEQAQAAHPGATVRPSRAEMIQQYEAAANEIPNDPVTQQRLRDTIFSQNPEAFPEEATALRNRGRLRTAVDSAPPGYQRAVEEGMVNDPDPHIVRGVGLSVRDAQLVRDTNLPMKFRDGSRPAGQSGADIATLTRDQVDEWVQGFDREGNVLPDRERNRGWQRIDRKMAPVAELLDVNVRDLIDGPVTPGTRTSAAARRLEFTKNVMEDAVEGAKIPGKTSKVGSALGTYTNMLRQAMLFNYLNSLHYIAANLTSNSLNVKFRGGGIRPMIDTLTDLKEMSRIYGNAKDPTARATTIDAMFSKMKVGDRPNIKGGYQSRYYDRISKTDRAGKSLPARIAYQVVDKATRAVAPETLRVLDSVPDVGARIQVGQHAIQRGFKELNSNLPQLMNEELDKALKRQGQAIPAQRVQQVVEDFKNQHRTLEDPTNGNMLTGMFGKVTKFEPIYGADDFRTYMRENLTQDLPPNMDRAALNRAINTAANKVADRVTGIADNANATVDRALFSWRNTVGDGWMSKGFLFHYWASRQGGFYVSEMMAHPWVAAAYGRMMDEMSQQAEELGAPDWMKGWFQFMSSVGGFSTWFSPADMVQSLLTMADWQMGGDDPKAYEDLTALGLKFKQMPFFIHPAIQMVGYTLGLLGPDYPAPPLSGFETFGSRGIDLMNMGNAQGAGFMKPFNAMGIGVDANGDPIPINPKPLQQLYAEAGNFISSALQPLTGLSPVEVPDFTSGIAQDMRFIGEQEARRTHPEWQNDSVESAKELDRYVTGVLQDPSNSEYGRWYELASSEKFQLGEGVPQPLAGLLRNASPVSIMSFPEQERVTGSKGALDPSGNTMLRVPLDGTDPQASFIQNEQTYGVNKTVEGRQLTERVNDYYGLIPPDLQEAKSTYDAIGNGNLPDGEITVGGVPYTNAELVDMGKGAAYDIARAYLSEKGYDEGSLDDMKRTQLEYLGEHQDVATFMAWDDLIRQAAPEGTEAEQQQAFTQQMMQTNPGFAQYVQSSMTDHITGVVDYSKVKYTDAFLAALGVQGSVYGPTKGTEPSTAEGGYPSIPGIEPGQPILQTMGLDTNVVGDSYVYREPGDVGWADNPEGHEPIAIIKPDLPIQVIGPSVTVKANAYHGEYEMYPVAQNGNPVGYVDGDLLLNISRKAPVSTETVQQPGGGLTETAGKVTDALGGAKDALLGGVSGLVGGTAEAIGGAVPEPPTMTAPAVSAPSAGGNPLDAIGAGIGGAIDAVGNVVNTITGHNSGTPQKPAITTPPDIAGSGTYDVVKAKDGMGIQSTEAGTDRTWMEDMMGGHATVTTDYKNPAPIDPATGKPVSYLYQEGHGAIDGEHAAYDISCDTGNCAGTPVKSPVGGKVVCAGYGQGTGEALNSAGAANSYGCTYSEGTTTANNDGSAPAHTVTIDVGTDPQGNAIQLSFNHMGTSNLTPGQTINPGDLIGGMGNTGGGPHTHLEAWGYSPELGTYKILDPALVVGGYYNTHSVDDTSTTPAPTTPSTTTAAPSTIPSKVTPRTSPGLTPGDPAPYQPLVKQAAAANGVPPEILSALLRQESQYDPAALSPAGAQGIAQFMPETAAGMGIDPYDPNQAIPAAAQYLKQNYDATGSWDMALAAYNAGLGNVQKYGGIPPFEETQNYVSTIMGNANLDPGALVGGALSDAVGGVLGRLASPVGAQEASATPTYTAPNGTEYDFVDASGKPTTPNYGYFDTSATAYPDNADGTRALPPKYIVYHYTATDSMDGFINDFMGQTQKSTSSNYVLDKDGTLYTVVPPDYTAWANGRVDMAPADATPGANLNQESISIEIVNNGSEPYTPEQIATLQQWTADMSSQYGIASDHLLAHSDVTSDKSDPGTYFPWGVVRRAATPTP